MRIAGRNHAGDAVLVVRREPLRDDRRTMTGTVTRYCQASAELSERVPDTSGITGRPPKGSLFVTASSWLYTSAPQCKAPRVIKARHRLEVPFESRSDLQRAVLVYKD